jgi:hypothetical protein
MQLGLARFGFLSLKKSPPRKTLQQGKELRKFDKKIFRKNSWKAHKELP